MDIGKKIKEFRKKRGITQKKLSELSDVHEVQIRRYESNATMPSIETMIKIAEALDVEPHELLYDGADEQNFNNISTRYDKLLADRGILNIVHKITSLDGCEAQAVPGGVEIFLMDKVFIVNDKTLLEIEKSTNDYLKFKLSEVYQNILNLQNNSKK